MYLRHGGEHLAYFCMTVIGIGYLFPISAIWAAFDYWKTLYPNTNIEFTVTGVYQTGSMVTVIVLMLSKSFSLGPRILGGFAGQFLSLAVIFAFRWMPIDTDILLWLLMGVVLFVSVATGYLDSAVLALCSQYSPKMQGYLQLGIGLGTMVSVLYRDTTKLLLAGDVANATTAYFAVAMVTVLICVSHYRLLMALPVSKDVRTLESPAPMATNSPTPPEGSGPREHNELEAGRKDPLLQTKHEDAASATCKEGEHADFASVLPIVWKNQLTVFLNLFLTTLCYPGLITSVPCRQFTNLCAESWFQTLLLTAFTVADIVGRFMTGDRCRMGLNWKNIWVTVVIRAFIFPVILFCIESPSSPDSLAFAIIAFFGMMNGFCVSLSLIVMNQIPHMTAEQRMVCGRISACSVNGGLCAGSLAAAALSWACGIGAQ